MIKIISILVLLFLSACMVGPNFKEPAKAVATSWSKNDKSVQETQIQDENWWKVFHDPVLTSLIHQGYQNNLSLHSAGIKVLQARAQLAETVGSLYPQQQALAGTYNYQRIGGTSLQQVLPSNIQTLALGVSASWELDFWGKYRRAILANDAAFLAAYAAYDNTLVNLTADIATAYIDIRTTEELISVTQKNIQVQKIGLNIAKARFNAGEASLLDVEQAQTELSETQSALPNYVSDLQRQKDRLAVLLALTPDKVNPLLKKKRGIPKAPTSVAAGIPKEALARRPDVYQARMEAIAQSEQIGAVKANLYPSFSLTGTFAFASNNIPPNGLGDMFQWSNRNISAGPTFSWPLLNYGQITNAVRVQDAVFEQALLKYLNLVLQAQQEVQDHITEFIETRKSEHFLTTANVAAIKSTQLALVRYREGESDYTPVLDSERQQLRVQTSLTIEKGKISQALVGLYRSLGGGWQIHRCKDIIPEQIKHEMAARTNWGVLLKPENHQPAVSKKQVLKERYLPTW